MTFLDDVARALFTAGRSLELDLEACTIDVASASAGSVLAVVRPVARAVTFYVVHPTTVPATSLGAISELTVRATADLLDASLELDLATGSVAVRFPVVLGELVLAEDELAGLLDAALETVEAAGVRYLQAVDGVLAGTIDARTAAVAVRTAPVTDLADEVDRL